MLPRSYIEAIDQLTILYLINTMVSVQQMNLQPEALYTQNDTIFCQSLFTPMWDHLAMLKFLWLHNHHSIITYIYIYIRQHGSAVYVGMVVVV